MTNLFDTLSSATETGSGDFVIIHNFQNEKKTSVKNIGTPFRIENKISSGILIGTITIDGVVNSIYCFGGDADQLSVTLSCTEYEYTGQEICTIPTVQSYDGSTTYVKDEHYTLNYLNNINAGTATVQIIGNGSDILGTTERNYTINKIDGMILYTSLDSSTGLVSCWSNVDGTSISNDCGGCDTWNHSKKIGSTECVSFNGTNQNYFDSVNEISVKCASNGKILKYTWFGGKYYGDGYDKAFAEATQHYIDFPPSKYGYDTGVITAYEQINYYQAVVEYYNYRRTYSEVT